jgi:hypothetical protein
MGTRQIPIPHRHTISALTGDDARISAQSLDRHGSRHAKAKCTITSRPLRSSPISAPAPSASNASTITQSSRKCSISPRTPILCNCGHRSAPSWAQRRRAGATNRPSRSGPSRNHLAAHTRRTSCTASAPPPGAALVICDLRNSGSPSPGLFGCHTASLPRVQRHGQIPKRHSPDQGTSLGARNILVPL